MSRSSKPRPVAGRAGAWHWLLLALAALLALRHVWSDWHLAASRDLGPTGDIGIYIGAINFLKGGGALYDFPLEGGYGFTYPPFAAIALRPLTWLAPTTTGLIWLTVCVLVAVVVATLVAMSRAWPDRAVDRASAALLATSAFLGSSQVQSDLITGQVNLVLALLIILDVGRFVPKRLRGALVGLAAAVKLTPMVIWGWYVLTRQWRALATSVGVFGACVCLAWIVLPRDSSRYWTETVFDTSRVGDTELRFNSTVMGVLARAGVDGSARAVLWLVVGGVFVLLAFWNAQRSRRSGDPVAAAVILGCAAVIATPIAWPHHQIWLPLAGIVLVTRRAYVLRVLGLAVVLFAYFHIPLTLWWDARDLGWFFNNVDFAMFAGVCLFGLGIERGADAEALEPSEDLGRSSRSGEVRA